MNGKYLLILSVALVVAALLLVVGFNLNNFTQKDSGQVVVQIPSYLSKGTQSDSEGSLLSGSDGSISFAADDSGNQKRLISVSGSVVKTAAPDEAIITFSVQTLDKSAAKSQSDNAVTAQAVMDALKAAGISESDIKTVSYTLYEYFQWNETMRRSESIGYRTTNRIQATVKDLSKTGRVIDAAVQAGANSVSGVSFALSDAKQSDLKVAALQEASANAKSKAQSIASGLGITVGQVFSASESSNYVVPYYRNYAMEKSDSMGATAPTPITPGDIEFSATVSVQFEIQ